MLFRSPDPYLKGHGSLAHAYKWYSKILPPPVVEMVDRVGFGGFVRLLEKSTNDLVHVYALVERWWDSTNTFHLPFEEMTMTPYDFSMITGLKVDGDRLVMDIPFERQPALVTALIGGMPPSLEVCHFPYNWLHRSFCKPDPGISNEQLLRAFLLYVLECSLLAT